MHVQTYDLNRAMGYNLGVIGVALVLAWIGIYVYANRSDAHWTANRKSSCNELVL